MQGSSGEANSKEGNFNTIDIWIDAARKAFHDKSFSYAIYCCDVALFQLEDSINLSFWPQRSVNISSRLNQIYELRGKIYFEQGLYQQAEESFIMYNWGRPCSFDTKHECDHALLLADTYRKQKKYHKAQELYQGICKASNGDLVDAKTKAYYGLALIKRAYGDKSEEIKYLNIVISRLGDASARLWLLEIYRELYVAYYNDGKRLEASHLTRRWVEVIAAEESLGPELIYNKTVIACYCEFKEYDKAVAFYDAMYDKETIDSELYANLAKAYFEVGNFEKSSEFYKKAIEGESDIARRAELYKLRVFASKKDGKQEPTQVYNQTFLICLARAKLQIANDLVDRALQADANGDDNTARNLYRQAKEKYGCLVVELKHKSFFSNPKLPRWVKEAIKFGVMLVKEKLTRNCGPIPDDFVLDGSSFECQYIQAVALRVCGPLQRSIECFESIDISTHKLTMEQKFNYYHQLIIAHHDLLQYEKALHVFEMADQVLESTPHTEWKRYHAYAYDYGIILLKLGRFQQAAQKFVEVVDLCQHHADFKLFLDAQQRLVLCNWQLEAISQQPIKPFSAVVLVNIEAFINVYDGRNEQLVALRVHMLSQLYALRADQNYQQAAERALANFYWHRLELFCEKAQDGHRLTSEMRRCVAVYNTLFCPITRKPLSVTELPGIINWIISAQENEIPLTRYTKGLEFLKEIKLEIESEIEGSKQFNFEQRKINDVRTLILTDVLDYIDRFEALGYDRVPLIEAFAQVQLKVLGDPVALNGYLENQIESACQKLNFDLALRLCATLRVLCASDLNQYYQRFFKICEHYFANKNSVADEIKVCIIQELYEIHHEDYEIPRAPGVYYKNVRVMQWLVDIYWNDMEEAAGQRDLTCKPLSLKELSSSVGELKKRADFPLLKTVDDEKWLNVLTEISSAVMALMQPPSRHPVSQLGCIKQFLTQYDPKVFDAEFLLSLYEDLRSVPCIMPEARQKAPGRNSILPPPVTSTLITDSCASSSMGLIVYP